MIAKLTLGFCSVWLFAYLLLQATQEFGFTDSYSIQVFYGSHLFFSIVVMIFVRIGFISLKSQKLERFSQYFLLMTTLKLLCSAFFALIITQILKDTNHYYMIAFLINYLLYTILEVYLLIHFVKEKQDYDVSGENKSESAQVG